MHTDYCDCHRDGVCRVCGRPIHGADATRQHTELPSVEAMSLPVNLKLPRTLHSILDGIPDSGPPLPYTPEECPHNWLCGYCDLCGSVKPAQRPA